MSKLVLIIGISIILVIIIFVVVIILVLRRRRHSQVSPPDQIPSPPPQTPDQVPSPSPPMPPPPTGTRYYLANECPDKTVAIGKIGLIAFKDDLSNIPFQQGISYPNSDWYFVHPQVCATSDPGDNASQLYKFVATQDSGSVGKVGFLWDTSSATPSPFTMGIPWGGTWSWTHPYLTAASNPGGYHISNRSVGTGPIGIIGDNQSLATLVSNLGDGSQGAEFNTSWTWVHPHVEAE